MGIPTALKRLSGSHSHPLAGFKQHTALYKTASQGQPAT